MAIDADVAVDYVNKIVKRSAAAGATVYSVNSLYSYLMDLFDELAQMDDQVPASAQTPTAYSFINEWYIQEALTQFLNGGAIQTTGYNDEVHTLVLDGVYVNCVTTDIGKQVKDDGADVGALLDYDNTAQKWWIRIGSSTPIANNSVMTIDGGTGAGDALGASVTGETIFANPYTLGTLEGTPQLYIYQNAFEITNWWSTGHFDILIKVREANTDIDSKKITVFGRHWTDEYTTFEITLTTAGQNPIPLGTKDDLNNQSSEADVEDLQDGTVANIAINFSFAAPYSYDIGDGNGSQPYEVQIDCDSRRLSDVYEVVKFWTRTGSVKQLETGGDGSFVNGEAYRFANTVYAELVVSPLGSFAGGKFFGARSIYFVNLHADDAQAFQLIDKNGVTRYPPNYQSFLVTALVAGDRVAIFPEASGDVNKSQYNIKAAQGAGVAYVDIGVAIPADTPASGTVVVRESTTGVEEVLAYTSWSGDRFTLSGVTANAYDAVDTVYAPYIYEEAATTSVSVQVTYIGDKAIILRVRKKGILPFEVLGTFGITGYAASAIRTLDNVVT